MNEDNEKRSFRSLGLTERTLEAIEKKGFEEPTEIQALCIPMLLEEGTEVIGQAETGTGKTAAFALPILETVDEEKKEVQALILTPTRELCLQVAEEINSLKSGDGIDCIPVYGGAGMENQIRKLKKGVQIVVGTPGRILDHIRRGTLVLSALAFMVLDEADEMLDMGFIEDIEEILKSVPEKRRMLMFSATIPPRIQALASSYMKNAVVLRTQKRESTTQNADQIYYEVREADKGEALTRIIDRCSDFYGVIFCRTKNQCDEVGHMLERRGYEAAALHGDLSQREREIILRKMREKTIRILVATDVAARGLDIQDLSHVINYSLPRDPEIYIHRVGRTGRAGKEGTAITFITPGEARRFSYIKKASKAEIRREEIPSPKEVVENRKEKITQELEEALISEKGEEYREVALTLLEGKESADVVSSLLHHFYGESLDVNQYRDIAGKKEKEKKRKESPEKTRERKDRERPYDRIKTPSMDEGGVTRLFIARGRNDGLTKKALVDIIYEATGVRDRELMDITVMDDYTFVNAPYEKAEHILEVFKNIKQDGRTVITKARAPRSVTDGGKEKKKSKGDNSYGRSKKDTSGRREKCRETSERTFTRDEKAYFEWEKKMEERKHKKSVSTAKSRCTVKEKKVKNKRRTK